MKQAQFDENVAELAIGITAEEMKALYFNATALKEAPYKLYQLNSRGKRYYYSLDGEGKVTMYPSVTTILHDIMPENKILTSWKVGMGKEASEAYTMDRANYGTFIHGQLAGLMLNRTYNLDNVYEEISKYAERNCLPVSFADSHEEEAKADIISFAKWMRDYDVRPYAIEIAIYSPTLKIAGMIDCVCSMRKYPIDDKKEANNPERINAIVDFKSGKKGFHDEYKIQLELYRQMWNENFPDTPIEQIFNIAPKDWLGTVKKQPSYSFEEQTNDPILAQIPHLLAIFSLRDTDERKVVNMTGTISLDEPIENVKVYTLSELVEENSRVQ